MNLQPSPDVLKASMTSRLTRLFLGLALAFLGTAIACIAAFAACFPFLAHGPGPLPAWASAAFGATVALVLVGPPATVGFIVWKGRLTWGLLAVAAAVVVPVAAWMAWDDPAVEHPVSFSDLAPAQPGDEESYRVLMEYSRRNPSAEARAYLEGPRLRAGTQVPERWAAGAGWVQHVVANRELYEANWRALAPQRAWLARLNAFPRVGDLTQKSSDDIPDLQVWRELTLNAAAVATLRAVDHRPDEALDILLSVLEPSRKMALGSRSTIRLLFGWFGQGRCVDAAKVVLDVSRPSPAARARLASAIQPARIPGFERRIAFVGYPLIEQSLGEGLGSLVAHGSWSFARIPLGCLGRLFLNPNATLNQLYAAEDRIATLEAARETAKADRVVAEFTDRIALSRNPKNWLGRAFVVAQLPSFPNVYRNYWERVDGSAALLARLSP